MRRIITSDLAGGQVEESLLGGGSPAMALSHKARLAIFLKTCEDRHLSAGIFMRFATLGCDCCYYIVR